MRRLLSRGALAWVCFGAFAYACSGEERTFVDGNAGKGGTSGAVSTGGASGSSSGKGGTSGAGTSGDAGGPDPGGSGGEGGGGEPEPPPPPGRPGTALVAGGHKMSSTNYQLFSIVGNGVLPTNASSTNYRLHGGIVGTTQP